MGSFNRNNRNRASLHNISVDNLKVPLEEALNMDLKEAVIPGVYPDKLNGDFSKTYLVQIKKIAEIGPNKVLNGGGGYQRSLLLTLSDGYAAHKALEVGEIPGLSLNTRPGTKLVLFGPKLRIVGNSFMYLDSYMAQVVGGGISEMNAKWEMKESLESQRLDNQSREGGAPAWAPFGKKINKDSVKAVKSNAPQKEEKKNPAFDSQRNDAIRNASEASRPAPPKKTGSGDNPSKFEKTVKRENNIRNQAQRQIQHRSDPKPNGRESPQRFSSSSAKAAPSKSAEKTISKEPASQSSTSFPRIQTEAPKEPAKIAQKEIVSEPVVPLVKKDYHKESQEKSSGSTRPSFYDQFQKPPPNMSSFNQENQEWKSRNYSGGFSKNQSEIVAPPQNSGTDYSSFPIASQSYTSSNYSSNLPNQPYTQNEYFIQSSVPAVVASTTRSDYDYKPVLPSQSHLPFPNAATYPSPVTAVPNYSNTSYFDTSLQPPLPAFNKGDFADNYVPPQTLVFTSSAYADGQAQNQIPGFVGSNYDIPKLPYTRNQFNQFNEPPPSSFDSQTFTRSNYSDGSSQNWIQQKPAETDNKVQSYQYLKSNFNAMQSQSPPIQTDYDNQSQVYSKSNFSNGNNVPQKLPSDYALPYQMNSVSNYNSASQKPVQKYNQNNYEPQSSYVYNRRGSSFSGGGFSHKNNEDSFSSRQYPRPNTRPQNRMNDQRPRLGNARGARGRGFAHSNQPRFPSPATQQPAMLYEYLDNKLHLNTG